KCSEKKEHCHCERKSVAVAARTDQDPKQGDDAYHGKREPPGPQGQIALREDTVIERDGERDKQDDQYAEGEPSDAAIGPVAQFAPFALKDEPAGAKQGISEYKPDPGQD